MVTWFPIAVVGAFYVLGLAAKFVFGLLGRRTGRRGRGRG